MGTKGKGKRALERRKQRRNAKEKQRELYASFAAQGKSKGSKRQRANAGRRLVQVVSHPNGPCGNVGCGQCGLGPYKGKRHEAARQAARQTSATR